MNRITCFDLGENKKAREIIASKDVKIQEGLSRLVSMPEAQDIIAKGVTTSEDFKITCILWAGYLGKDDRTFRGMNLVDSILEHFDEAKERAIQELRA